MILYLHILNILLAFCACDGTGTKAFIFHDTEDGNLTTATLTNAPREPLPEHFLICSSHNQQQIDTPNTYVSGYVLYEDSDFTNPWFNIKYDRFGQLEINIKYNNVYFMGHVTLETFLYWIHTCVEVDTITGTLRASANGVLLKTIDNNQGLKSTPAPRLNLRLGVVHESFYGYYNQFIGGVGNIKIFNLDQRMNDSFLEKASADACKHLETPLYLSWSDTKWSIIGSGSEKITLDDETLCNASKRLNGRIPSIWNKIDASDECGKFGMGIIAKPTKLKNLSTNDLKDIYGKHYDQCRYFWTPFTDEYTEGTFIDEVTNETIR